MSQHAERARRALRMPPRVLVRRLADELVSQTERVRGPLRAQRFDDVDLLRLTGHRTIDELWTTLAAAPSPFGATRGDAERIASLLPAERSRVVGLADAAVDRTVDLLGSGPVSLGSPIPWLTDVKTGTTWPTGDPRRLDLARLGHPSDVKLPWELSRLQWLLPAGQAYLLTGDERYAGAVRDVLDEWIGANPYGRTVNWAIAMETALRILSWTYLFHACGESASWQDTGFRSRFLRALWLHGDFTARHLERSTVNGNHLDADAAGLVFAGLFFPGERCSRWSDLGWGMLTAELPRQVTPDGVDFEMSAPYHRLVTELFLLPALYRLRRGLPVAGAYRDRLAAMARFASTYTRSDGSSPLWGDGDDGRALPLGGQGLGDHRYLAGLVGLGLGCDAALDVAAGPRSEAVWLLGPDAAARLPVRDDPAIGTTAFRDAGVYVLRGPGDHVFIDCGDVGLAGRGGHGHNDCLSLEAVLDGTLLLVDCGSYVYTASVEERDRFRSTGFHNTPQVDAEEQNRFVGSPWGLANDAIPRVRHHRFGEAIDLLIASHSGYARLESPVTPVRTIALDRTLHALAIRDAFEGTGSHDLSVPLHLAPEVEAAPLGRGRWNLRAGGRDFLLAVAEPLLWQASLEGGWRSPAYGVRVPIQRLVLRRSGRLEPLLVTISPGSLHDPLAWALGALADT